MSQSGSAKMITTAGNFVLGLGIVLLVNAGYSAIQHRTYLKLVEEPFHGLPLDISLQTWVAFALTMVGTALSAGFLKNIKQRTAKSSKYLDHRANFCTFNHRGRVVFKDQPL